MSSGVCIMPLNILPSNPEDNRISATRASCSPFAHSTIHLFLFVLISTFYPIKNFYTKNSYENKKHYIYDIH